MPRRRSQNEQRPRKPSPPQDIAMTNSTAAYFTNSSQPAWMQPQGPGDVSRPSTQFRRQQLQPIEAAQPKGVTAQSVAMTMGSLPSPAPSAGSIRGTPEVLQTETFAAEDAMRRQSSHAIPQIPSQQGVSQTQQHQQLSRPASRASSQNPMPNGNMQINHPGPPAGSVISSQSPAQPLPDIQLLRQSQQNHLPQQSFQPQAHLPSQASFQPQAYYSNQPNGGTQHPHVPAPIHPALYYQGSLQIAQGYFNSKLSNGGKLEAGLELQQHLLTTALAPGQSPDAVYLIVFQLVCVYLVDSSALPPPIRAIPGAKASLNTLAIIISNGRGLAKDFCATFSMFPRHVSQITLLPQELLDNVKSLLTNFIAQFPKACNDVHRRGYPLLPDEIALLFQMYSISLQKLVNDHIITNVFNVRAESDEMGNLRRAFATWQAAFFQQRLRSPHISHESLEILKTQFAYSTKALCLKALQSYASSHPVAAPGTITRQGTFNQQPVPARNVSHRSRPSSSTSFSPSVQGTLPLPRTSAAPAGQIKNKRGELMYSRDNQHPSQAMPSIYGFLDLHLWDKPMKIHHDTKLAGPFYQVSAESPMRQATIKTSEPLHELKFDLSEADISALPEVRQISSAHPKEWLVKDTTQILRFRCVEDEREVVKKDTRSMPTHWPHNVYFSFNGHNLEPRRKAQWHKDLPIDLTTFAKAGSNTLSVFINQQQSEDAKSYTLIVDRVALKTTAEILADVYARIRPASEFLDGLNGTQSTNTDRTGDTSSKLTDDTPGGIADDDDDEVLILDTTTTIPILDPISSGPLCAQPLRSTSCRHPQPFDLDIFLQSRPRKAGDDVYAFDWSCPICKSYAGPETLQVEEFLVQVASELGKMGRADARAIVVGKDGKWVPAEEKTGSSGRSACGRNDGRLKRQASDDSVLGVEIINID